MTEQKYKVFADWSAFVAIITAEKRLPNKDTLIRSAGAIVSTSHTDAILKKMFLMQIGTLFNSCSKSTFQ